MADPNMKAGQETQRTDEDNQKHIRTPKAGGNASPEAARARDVDESNRNEIDAERQPNQEEIEARRREGEQQVDSDINVGADNNVSERGQDNP